MKEIDFDKTWIGFVVGLFVPFITFTIYYLINYHYMTIRGFFHYLKLGETFSPVMSLCVLVNLGVFYLFLWKEKYLGTRGVIGATFFWAAVVIYLKFFI